MNKKIFTIFILIISMIIFLSFTMITNAKLDHTYYAQEVFEILNKKIKNDELLKTSEEKGRATYFYLDNEENTISIFNFEEKKVQYQASINIDELETKEHAGDLLEWRYHELNHGNSLIWGISQTVGTIEVK